jgi:maltooligosyltrehalose trehalohydrolase
MTQPKPNETPQMAAWREGTAVCVRTWAPGHSQLSLVLYEGDGKTVAKNIPMTAEPGGFFFARAVEGKSPFLYKILVDDGEPFPDPWSLSQPFGVHGPSSLPAPFNWKDSSWEGVPLESLILYEVHVGTATPEGTFDALVQKLPLIRELGATAIELLPLASFSGQHNWGYDGVSLFAPAAPYGGPDGLKRLVEAAHEAKLAIIIDAVYNHFGPEGNYLRAYSPFYFTSRHPTPWGEGINYDGEHSGPVRELALRNAEMWIRDYRADGLRLDATHAITDETEPHLLTEIVRRAKAAGSGRAVWIMAEDERNEARLVMPESKGGYGLDGVWADDFHHQMRRAFAKDSEGYFRDFSGSPEDICRTLNDGWFYRGQESAHSGHPRGTACESISPLHFIYCIQNHDQIGNRPLGNRLGEDVSPAAFRAMSALLLVSPYTPLLFAGQEWNSKTPFLYFTDHSPDLGKLVTEGRRKEFSAFSKFSGAEIPDPQALQTFLTSKLRWAEREEDGHLGVWTLYRELLALRKNHPALTKRARGSFRAEALGPSALGLYREGGGQALQLVVNIEGTLEYALPHGYGPLLFTEEGRFGGSGVLEKQGGKCQLSGPCALLLERP